MDVTQLPFNRLIGLELADSDSGGLVRLPDGPQYKNHLGTVHAGALLAVAEAGTGAFLSQQFGDSTEFVPVVRKVEMKFRRPASGAVYARCKVQPDAVIRWSDELATRGRVSAEISVEVVDATGVAAAAGVVEWFISKSTRSV